MTIDSRALLMRRLLPAALLCAVALSAYAADPDTSTDTSDKVDLGTIGTGTNTATPLETVDIYATRGTASAALRGRERLRAGLDVADMGASVPMRCPLDKQGLRFLAYNQLVI